MREFVYGGYGSYTNLNTVNISGGTIQREVYGGYSDLGSVINNTVNISGGTIQREVYGGYSLSGLVINNTVNITGGTMNGLIYGGYSYSGSATNNTINISGNPTFGSTTILVGNNKGSGTGNTLNIRTKDIKVKNIENFEFINLYLLDSIKANDTILKVNDAITFGGSNTKLNVSAPNSINSNFNIGDSITLISSATSIDTSKLTISNTSFQASSLAHIYNFDITSEAQAINATLNTKADNPAQKALSEPSIGSLAFINQASDLTAGFGMDAMVNSQANLNSSINSNNSNDNNTNSNNLASFSALNISDTRSNSGSHVDTKGVSILVGISKSIDEEFIYGMFVELGKGNYDSYNSFNTSSVHGSGDSKYYGFGLMSKLDFKDSYYFENSFRVGQIKSDYESEGFDLNSNPSFDSKKMYYGAHLGVGNIIKLNTISNLDIYTKILYTRTSSENINIDSNDFKFASVNSIRSKTGARYNYELNQNSNLYAGIAYEYEFDSKVKAKNLSTNYDIDVPTLKGSTGILEVGYKVLNTKGFNIDLNLQGLSGKKEGVSGGIGVEWRL
ncbi:autotransporter outer membrane beta-barrel domain-containing protein [Campylobacter hyointestinalis subsp. hyointestinalis]|uniref:autotransporter outer membrane beta-barrel domain-containing protein n=1 Tax=Campylobacter hyointestinalis TaxID=198 RepID=UPI0010FF7A42|nr:autotransporter outer membrane beta-barrel domain-containing protein [Campylobacter hyointestinalis]QCT99540.1 autotransporter outer membrane beta-barrel domain-containing protein [Campylobacter hyointestinalis subsp. hyointestinalis]